jgi:hypothetical protein
MPEAAAASNDTDFMDDVHQQHALFKILFGEESDTEPNAVEKPVWCRKRHRGKTACPLHAPASGSTEQWRGESMEEPAMTHAAAASGLQQQCEANPSPGPQPSAVAADPSPNGPSSSKGPRPRHAAPNVSNDEWTCEHCGRIRAAIYRSCAHCGAARTLAPAMAQDDNEEEEATLPQESSDTDDDDSWKEVVKEAAAEDMLADGMRGMPLVIQGPVFPQAVYREGPYDFMQGWLKSL